MEQTYLIDINLRDELIVLKSIKPKGFLLKLNFSAAHKDVLMFDINTENFLPLDNFNADPLIKTGWERERKYFFLQMDKTCLHSNYSSGKLVDKPQTFFMKPNYLFFCSVCLHVSQTAHGRINAGIKLIHQTTSRGINTRHTLLISCFIFLPDISW